MKLRVLALPLTVMMVLTHSASGQFAGREFGMGYTYTAPINTMKQHIRQGNGFTMDFYLIPEKNTRYAFGADLNFSIYGHDKTHEAYTLEDGTVAPMDIVVDNYFVNLMGSVRYYLIQPEGKIVKPYVNLKAGYSWFRTELNIYDPDDNDHCEPVDSDLLIKDGTFVFSGGAGFHWDLSSIFKKKAPDRFLFNIGANLTMGGKVNYMNTDPPSGHHTPESTVDAVFLNTQTQTTHEHHVGYVYTSFAEMIEIRAGFIFRLTRTPIN